MAPHTLFSTFVGHAIKLTTAREKPESGHRTSTIDQSINQKMFKLKRSQSDIFFDLCQ